MNQRPSKLQQLVDFLEQGEQLQLMKKAMNAGHPPVDLLDAPLLREFGEGIRADSAKQLVGKAVREVLEGHGYRWDSYGHVAPNSSVFSSGSKYV